LRNFATPTTLIPPLFYLQRKKRQDMSLPQTPPQRLPIETMTASQPDTRQWQIELTLPNGVVLNMSTEG